MNPEPESQCLDLLLITPVSGTDDIFERIDIAEIMLYHGNDYSWLGGFERRKFTVV